MINRIENIIDRAIGVLLPKSEYNRRIARLHTEKIRQYAAAKASRLLGDWLPANQDVNTIIRQSDKTLKSRTRQLVRDFPYFNRAINTLVNYTVGTGIRFQGHTRKNDGTFNKKIIAQIEDAVAWGLEELDASGKLHGYELERLAKRQDVESGEFLFVKTLIKDPKRYIPYALMPYETDWLTDSYTTAAKGNVIDQGIEYDPQTGRVVAYHFAVPSGYAPSSVTASTKTQRILAENVIHNFHTLRPGQLRGVSPFVTAILVAHDLGDYLDAEIDTAKQAARYLAFVKTPDISGFQGLRTTTDSTTGQKIESIENAIIEYLRPGEDISIAQHNRPNANFEGFVRFILHIVAVATDVTYELLTSDYDGINYSNLRGIRNDFSVMMKPHQQRHITHFSRPVTHDIITHAVIAGRLNIPGFFGNQRHYFKGTYTPPGMESIDPLREGKAWIDQIKAGLRSPQEIAAARGRDYEEIITEIAEAKKIAEQKGLDWNALFDISTTTTQNPAKLGASEGEKAETCPVCDTDIELFSDYKGNGKSRKVGK